MSLTELTLSGLEDQNKSFNGENYKNSENEDPIKREEQTDLSL